MKKNLFAMVGLGVLLLSQSVMGATGYAPDKGKIFMGKVIPIVKSTIKYGFNDAYRGIINKTARPGQIVYGPVYNARGEIVKPGTLLIQMKTDYRKALVDNAAATVKLDESNLAYAKVEYLRYKKLSKTKAVSQETFQHWQNEYYLALNKLAADKATLKLNQTVYKTCWLRAEYDAIVDKVFFPFGLPAAELDVMQISQLRPIFVHVKMDRDLARTITNETPIAIYPVNSNKPVGVLNSNIILVDDGVNLLVENYQLPPVTSEKTGKPVFPVSCYPVIKLYSTYPEQNVLAAPVEAICKDATGAYVWKAVGVKCFQPDKGMPSLFHVKKVYVTLVDRICKLAGAAAYQQISSNKELAVNDILVLNPSKEIQENDEVSLENQRFLFMPGDIVKVVIGKTTT